MPPDVSELLLPARGRVLETDPTFATNAFIPRPRHIEISCAGCLVFPSRLYVMTGGSFHPPLPRSGGKLRCGQGPLDESSASSRETSVTFRRAGWPSWKVVRASSAGGALYTCRRRLQEGALVSISACPPLVPATAEQHGIVHIGGIPRLPRWPRSKICARGHPISSKATCSVLLPNTQTRQAA